MKRLALLFSVVVMTSTISLAAGPLVSFGAHGNFASLNVPDPLKSVYGAGFGGGLHLDLRFGFLSVRLNGDYTSFGADENTLRGVIYNQAGGPASGAVESQIGVDGGRIGIISFALNGKFNLPEAKVSPYIVVGLGSGTLNMSDLHVTYQGAPVSGVSAAETVTKLLSNAGVGVDFNLGPVSMFLETKYTWIFTENEASTYLPITLGVTF